jgi:hypothetical protein
MSTHSSLTKWAIKSTYATQLIFLFQTKNMKMPYHKQNSLNPNKKTETFTVQYLIKNSSC